MKTTFKPPHILDHLDSSYKYDPSVKELSNTLVTSYRWYERALECKDALASFLQVPVDLLKVVPDRNLSDLSIFIDENGLIAKKIIFK